MFWFVKTVHNIQQDQKAKLDYHISVLFAYMAGGEGWGFKMFCQTGSEFFLLALCVCVCVCVWGGGQVQYFSFREKITHAPPINKRLVPITKSPKGQYVAYLSLRYFLLVVYHECSYKGGSCMYKEDTG